MATKMVDINHCSRRTILDLRFQLRCFLWLPVQKQFVQTGIEKLGDANSIIKVFVLPKSFEEQVLILKCSVKGGYMLLYRQ